MHLNTLALFVLLTASCGGTIERTVDDVDGGGDADADSDADSDADGDSDGDGDLDADTDVDGDGDADLDGDVDGDVDGDADETIDADLEPPCLEVGHDEDGDGVDDACDSCPSTQNADQLDTDGDGLGELCEWPERQEVLSEVVAFEPFFETNENWEINDGTWRLEDDFARGSSLWVGGNAFHVATVAPAYSIEASFVLGETTGGDPASGHYTGVLFAASQRDDGSWRWWGCFYEDRYRTVSVWRTGTMSLEQVASEASGDGSPRVGTPRRLRVFYDGGGRLVCAVRSPEGVATAVVSAEELWEDMSGQGGLRVYNEAASFSSFVVYR